MPAINLQQVSQQALNALNAGDRVRAFDLATQTFQDPKAGHLQHLLLSESYSGLILHEYSPIIRKAFLSFLDSNLVDHRKITSLWVSLLDLDPALKPIIDVALSRRFVQEDWDRVESALHDELIVQGLRKLLVSNPMLERFFREARKFVLLELWPKGKLKTKNLSFLCAMAEQCFINEYVYDVSQEEEAAVAALPVDNPIPVAIRGMYGPLLPHNINVKMSGVTGFRQMVATHITGPLKEKELRTQINTFCTIEDEVSKNVQAMYEENPYPTWIGVDLPYKLKPDITGEMLIAGCGTGRTTVQASYLMSGINLTAIDISKSSIAYAMRKVQELGMQNVEFRQGDIMNLPALGKTFDLVECSGVLHHMKDPVAGWRKLIDVLNPGGVMLICLYSTKARTHIQAVRDYIAEKGFKPTPDDIRRLRREIIDDDNSPFREVCTSRDFFTMSETRDLVFHIQEKTYTMIELKEIMEGLGLELMRLKLHSREIVKTFKERFPDDPAMTGFENWDKYEDEFPRVFGGMYKLVCRRKGDTGHNEAANAMLDALYRD